MDELENLVVEGNREYLVIPVCLGSQETLDLQDLSLIFNPSWNKSSNPKEAKKDPRLIHFLTCKLKLALWVLEDLQVKNLYI